MSHVEVVTIEQILTGNVSPLHCLLSWLCHAFRLLLLLQLLLPDDLLPPSLPDDMVLFVFIYFSLKLCRNPTVSRVYDSADKAIVLVREKLFTLKQTTKCQ
jgi:DNA-binding transcriptional regulator PaaX